MAGGHVHPGGLQRLIELEVSSRRNCMAAFSSATRCLPASRGEAGRME
jgi:hypothetical protein